MAPGRFNKRFVQIELPSAQKAPENIAGAEPSPILPCRRRGIRLQLVVRPALFASNALAAHAASSTGRVTASHSSRRYRNGNGPPARLRSLEGFVWSCPHGWMPCCGMQYYAPAAARYCRACCRLW
jgi:hypothetical protein